MKDICDKIYNKEYYLKQDLIDNIKVFAKNESYNVCSKIENNIMSSLYESECLIKPMKKKCCKVFLLQNERRKYWNEDLGLQKYIEIKINIIKEISSYLPKGLSNLKIEFFNDNEECDYMSLCYSIEVQENDFGKIFELLDSLINKIKTNTKNKIEKEHNLIINI